MITIAHFGNKKKRIGRQMNGPRTIPEWNGVILEDNGEILECYAGILEIKCESSVKQSTSYHVFH